MDELIKAGKTTHYKKGELLIRPVDDPDTIFIVVSGMIRSYVMTRQGEKNIHLIYGPREIFPLAWMIVSKPLNIYYEAVGNAEVARLKTEEVQRMVESDIGISNSLLRQSIRQFIVYKSRVDNLEYKFARERIAYRLLLLGYRFGKTEGTTIVMPRFSHDDIGNTINVSRESVSRELKRFELLGFISFGAGKLNILDSQGLRKEIGDEQALMLLNGLP